MNVHDYVGPHPTKVELPFIPATWDEEAQTYFHNCPSCGGNMWRAVVSFVDFDMAGWMDDIECLECQYRAKAPVPIAHPNYDG